LKKSLLFLSLSYHEEELGQSRRSRASFLLDDKLDSSRPLVSHRLRRRDRRFAQRGPELLRDPRPGGLLDHLLVPPLHRAVALSQVHDVAVRVGHHLDLEVARASDQPLQQQPVVAERGGGFPAGSPHGRGHFRGVAGDLHPFPPAAEDGLDEDGEADSLRLGAEAEREREEERKERKFFFLI